MFRRFGLFVLTLAMLSPLSAGAVSYDASSNQLPAAPDWARFDANTPIVGGLFGFNANQSVSGGVYEMGPSDSGKYTFWYSNAQTLDHTKTVELSARLKLISQTSVDPTNRSGLGIAITDDGNLYSEMYIGDGEIFLNKLLAGARVRDTAFTMDTGVFHDYTMRHQGSTISILVDGITRLAGSTFDASAIALPTLPNWASVGDITSNALGTWQMQSMSVNVFVPEPACGMLLIGGMLAGVSRRSRLNSAAR
jgi:hypothetical protein